MVDSKSSSRGGGFRRRVTLNNKVENFMISFKDKIYILDGAMGTMIQKHGVAEADNNSERLNLTRPDAIKKIHKEYIAAGADIIETNTFSANAISQEEYGASSEAARMAYEGARIAREAADEAAAMAAEIGLTRKVWVAGSMGPTSKSLSLSPNAGDPSFRTHSFDQMYEAYREQAEALIRGGVDMFLIETCFDALNTKAALAAIADCQTSEENKPVIISVSVGDRSGRTLTGQTLEAFYTSVCHYPIMAFGLNCSLGASELMPLVEDLNRWCRCAVSCYPNAGLPNEMGGYDQSPEEMGEQVREMASKGLVNIVGGCCGTTPDHIRAIAAAVKGISPRALNMDGKTRPLTVSGLEAVTVDVENNNFTNVGERTNVAGSRKFAKLIAEGKYDEGLLIAAKQIEDGAAIIDINMDDAMLDSTREMERFVRYISNEPAVAKAALMIDSSHWETILAGLKNAQGKCIVNSISLKEGPEEFVRKAKAINALGAAMVVMAFDEEGQATTYDRKIEICERAYRLLTEEAGVAPHDIIFDVNILSVGTGIEEHARYAVDFIEAVRWIKTNLPGALTSGGVSNLSFAFRGNNAVREAMHSAFLYHAIKAGMDMAIVNPSMLQIYDDIEPELLKCVEDVIFDTDPKATERLIDKATRMKETVAAKAETAHGHHCSCGCHHEHAETVSSRLKTALIKGRTDSLQHDLVEAMAEYGSAVQIIEGPLMEGMENVGKLFGEGKMFLPQVVKSAKVMRDAVEILHPYMNASEEEVRTSKPRIVVATVKGDVHDIGKNIMGIVLTCNGFEVHDLGVMVDKETILEKAIGLNADIIAVSGLITPSLFQMEELCREMSARGMSTPLFIGGATTNALHTAVRLAPLYGHVFHGPDASATAVMANKCMTDRKAFEQEQHNEQERIRALYAKGSEKAAEEVRDPKQIAPAPSVPHPQDIPAKDLRLEDVLPYFDWRMFYAIWGVKYGSASPEAMELMQLRQDAEEELALGNFLIRISARFLDACTDGNDIICTSSNASTVRLPMLRQEKGECMSLCDFIADEDSGSKSPLGFFTISVKARKAAHEEGCCCPACGNKYEDLVAKTVRMTLAEAASKWLDKELETFAKDEMKFIKPAAGYASCPDHTLKRDIMDMLSGEFSLGIKLTESCAMIPEASICGMIVMHPQAKYIEVRKIGQKQHDEYVARRGMDAVSARRFLGHLLDA
jgi:5-methyltetrahydrofolate--homocysteine methyltransferase